METREEIEKICLGGIISELKEKGSIETQVKPDHFSILLYKQIYETLIRQYYEEEVSTPDIMTLSQALPEFRAEISELTDYTLNPSHYQKLLLEISKRDKAVKVVKLFIENINEVPIDTAINELIATLEEAAEPTKRFMSWTDYKTQCENYDPSKDFIPSMFTGLRFSNGTLSYIGARPSGGKTSILINIAREALNAGRKAFYVNLEMLNRSIITNFILSYMFANANKDEREVLSEIDNPLNEYYRLFREGYTAQKVFIDLRQKSMTYLESIIGKKLFVYDGTRGTVGTIIRDIQAKVSVGDVVLLDYVQRLPAPKNSRDQRYIQIKEASNALLALAIKKNIVIISGAQFGRSKSEGEADMSDFRESGDIEQDAHNAIAIEAIGDPLDGKRYIHVLKAREGGAKFPREELECNFNYVYIAGTGKEYILSENSIKSKGKSGAKGITKTGKIIGEDGWAE